MSAYRDPQSMPVFLAPGDKIVMVGENVAIAKQPKPSSPFTSLKKKIEQLRTASVELDKQIERLKKTIKGEDGND